MNLRVDLILPTEQRSASAFNAKMLLRVVIIAVPSLIVAALVLSGAQLMLLNGELTAKQNEWDVKKPKKERAEALHAEVGAMEAILAECNGWRASKLSWHAELIGIMQAMPADMVLEMLRVEHQVVSDSGVNARAFKVVMRGKSYGDQSEQNVGLLKRNLAIAEAFSPFVQTVDVVINPDDSPEADKMDRIFIATVTYKLRKFQ